MWGHGFMSEDATRDKGGTYQLTLFKSWSAIARPRFHFQESHDSEPLDYGFYNSQSAKLEISAPLFVLLIEEIVSVFWYGRDNIITIIYFKNALFILNHCSTIRDIDSYKN